MVFQSKRLVQESKSAGMQVTRGQFVLLSLLTVCSILWLLFLTCYREYWGFWQSPEDYRFLTKEYPEWFRGYIHDFYDLTLCCVLLVYGGWLMICYQKLAESQAARISILLMTLLMGLTLGVLCSNNMINSLDSGQLHGKTHLQTRD